MASDAYDKERAYRQTLGAARRLESIQAAARRVALTLPAPDQHIADRRIAAIRAQTKRGFSLQPSAGHSREEEAEYWHRKVRSWLR